RSDLRLRNAIDEHGPQIHGDRRHRRADDAEQRVAHQRARRCRPGELHALAEILPDALRAAFRTDLFLLSHLLAPAWTIFSNQPTRLPWLPLLSISAHNS